jgi:hypothetical protein
MCLLKRGQTRGELLRRRAPTGERAEGAAGTGAGAGGARGPSMRLHAHTLAHPQLTHTRRALPPPPPAGRPPRCGPVVRVCGTLTWRVLTTSRRTFARCWISCWETRPTWPWEHTQCGWVGSALLFRLCCRPDGQPAGQARKARALGSLAEVVAFESTVRWWHL